MSIRLFLSPFAGQPGTAGVYGQMTKLRIWIGAIVLSVAVVAFLTVRRAPMRIIHAATLPEGVTKESSDAAIKSATSFLDEFVSKYASMLKQHVHPDFYDKFILSPNRSVSAKAFFSTKAEAFLYLYPSDDTTIEEQWSKYPLQLSILGGVGVIGSNARLLVPESELDKMFQSLKAMFNIKDKIYISISKLTLSSRSPKFFYFGTCSLIALHDMSFEVISAKDQKRNTTIDCFGFMTGDSDFSCVLQFAKKLAESFISSEIQELFKESEFFRKSLAHEQLRPEAEKIKTRMERAQKDSSYDYPMWQIEKDVKALRDSAVRYGIDASYVDKLMLSIKPMNGNLLGYYSDASGFMGQWFVVNSFVLFLLSLLFLNYNGVSIFILFPQAFYITIIPIVLGVNAFFIYNRPNGLPFYYWLPPWAVSLGSIGIIVFYLLKSTRST